MVTKRELAATIEDLLRHLRENFRDDSSHWVVQAESALDRARSPMRLVVSAQEVADRAIREATDAMLAECTEKEVAFFHKIHASAPWRTWDKCPSKELSGYHALVRRTMKPRWSKENSDDNG